MMNNKMSGAEVLAVMDEIVERMCDDGWSGIRDARNARAAVAAMIERNAELEDERAAVGAP